MSTSDSQPPKRGAHFGGSGQQGDVSSSQPSSGGSGQQRPTQRTADARGTKRQPTRGAATTSSSRTGTRRQTSSSGRIAGTQSAVGQNRVSSRTAAATQRVANHNVWHEVMMRGVRGGVPFVFMGVGVVAVVVFVVGIVTSDTGGEEEESTFVAGVEIEVNIPDGSGASSIASALYEAGVIESTSDFLNAVVDADAESSLQSGSYIFTSSTEYDDIIDLLTSGPNNTAYTITIPEGYTVAKIAALVEETFGIDQETFIAQAVASNYSSEYTFLADVENDSLEGYLFPKTYDFSTSGEITADTIIRAMLSQFQTEVASLDLATAASNLSSRYGIDVSENDIVIMASIIEREAVTDDQRGLISSVFWNRLSSGMYLQSDATMGYVTGGAVTSSDLQTDSEYNTYLYGGLTPTAICSPSYESLEAACNPEDTSYYFFYITDSVEAFSETYEEHLNAIASDS